jgi:hypothetical protein
MQAQILPAANSQRANCERKCCLDMPPGVVLARIIW